jgi:hypothetical protein
MVVETCLPHRKTILLLRACMLWTLPSNGRCLQSHCLATDLYATVYNTRYNIKETKCLPADYIGLCFSTGQNNKLLCLINIIWLVCITDLRLVPCEVWITFSTIIWEKFAPLFVGYLTNWKGFGRKRSCSNRRAILEFSWSDWRKQSKPQDSRYPGWDSTQAPPEHNRSVYLIKV